MGRDDLVHSTPAEARLRVEAARARRGDNPGSRYGRGEGRGVRKHGALSTPAALLTLCVALGGVFAWALGAAGTQAEAGRIVPLALSLPVEAGLFAFPVLTPLVLIAVHRLHWRMMRAWLRRAAQAVFAVWALAAMLVAYALL